MTCAGASDAIAVAEGAFAKGLTMTCPRCGEGDFERTADQVRKRSNGRSSHPLSWLCKPSATQR